MPRDLGDLELKSGHAWSPQKNRKTMASSTPQRPLRTPQIPSARDHKAFNRATLGVPAWLTVLDSRFLGSTPDSIGRASHHDGGWRQRLLRMQAPMLKAKPVGSLSKFRSHGFQPCFGIDRLLLQAPGTMSNLQYPTPYYASSWVAVKELNLNYTTGDM